MKVIMASTNEVDFQSLEFQSVAVGKTYTAVCNYCNQELENTAISQLKSHRIMSDRYNIHSQLEHLQSKYVGTGHADTTKFEWLLNQHRDSFSSYIGHFDMLNFFAIVENEAKARVKFNLMERMLQPCGPPPEKPED